MKHASMEEKKQNLEFFETGHSEREIAKKFGISKGQVSRIKNDSEVILNKSSNEAIKQRKHVSILFLKTLFHSRWLWQEQQDYQWMAKILNMLLKNFGGV